MPPKTSGRSVKTVSFADPVIIMDSNNHDVLSDGETPEVLPPTKKEKSKDGLCVKELLPTSHMVKFFSDLKGCKDIEIDAHKTPDCGPLRARPSKPLTLVQPQGTNMEWIGILMGKPRELHRRNIRKSNQFWNTTDRLSNDVFIRLKDDEQIQYVDSAGRIVSKGDIWLVHSFVETEFRERLIARKSLWDIAARNDKALKDEQYEQAMKTWQQEFFDHLHKAEPVGSPSKLPLLKRKREEKEEAIRRSMQFLAENGYTIVVSSPPASVDGNNNETMANPTDDPSTIPDVTINQAVKSIEVIEKSIINMEVPLVVQAETIEDKMQVDNPIDTTMSIDTPIDVTTRIDILINTTTLMDTAVDGGVHNDAPVDATMRMETPIDDEVHMDVPVDTAIRMDTPFNDEVHMDTPPASQEKNNGLQLDSNDDGMSTSADLGDDDALELDIKRFLKNATAKVRLNAVNTLMSMIMHGSSSSI